jgi:hypothetical protein
VYPMLGVQAHTLQTSTESWTTGRPVRTYTTAGVLAGSLQPTSGQDVERLPEGVRTQDARVLLSRSEVPVPVQQDGTPLAPARVMAADGVVYDVVQVAPYAMPGPVLRHWRVLLSRVPEHVSAVSP